MAIHSGADEVRAGIARQIRTDFDFNNVSDLVTTPTITQNPMRRTSSPCVYLYPDGQIEVDNTKDSVTFEYGIATEIRVRYDRYRGGKRQAEQIVDEVLSSVRGLNRSDYPVLNGYNIYRVVVSEIITNQDKVQGADWIQIIVKLLVTASEADVPAQILPVQEPTFTYSNFRYTPTPSGLERYDSGEITPSTTYPSGNNGWNFIDASYSVAATAQGTFTNGNYNVTSGAEPLALSSSLRYALDGDASTVTTLTDTTRWVLIDSIRYGSITPTTEGVIPTLTDDTAATYGLRNLANWNIEFGTVHPHNETITITGNAQQFPYIIIDHNVTLTQIQNTLGQNVISQWNVVTVGEYKVYINEQPIVFDGFSTDFTLIS